MAHSPIHPFCTINTTNTITITSNPSHPATAMARKAISNIAVADEPLLDPQLNAFEALRPAPLHFSAQLDAAIAVEPVGFPTVSELPTISWRQRRFVLEAYLYYVRSKG